MNIAQTLIEIRSKANLSQTALAQAIGTSLVSVVKWENQTAIPSPEQTKTIEQLYEAISNGLFRRSDHTRTQPFASHGIRNQLALPLFDNFSPEAILSDAPFPPIISRVKKGQFFGEERKLDEILSKHQQEATTVLSPPNMGISAGKNTYTYDAHTYHTKVPPQGIAELLKHYLPNGGLVMDSYAGSGMTGVACLVNGYDVILNELSPAACFIANRFNSSINPNLFQGYIDLILEAVADTRKLLYTTTCRECGKETELLYTVWSYQVICNHCNHEFVLWDHCRKYGKTVRDHKILGEFPCPRCQTVLKKSVLKRTSVRPVLVGYKCCGSKQQEVTHPPDKDDLSLISDLESSSAAIEGFYPKNALFHGVNLRQPLKHGFDRIDKFYTPRNLAAMSKLWETIHRIEDSEAAAFAAFVFTSLYQRVTRFSEFRFWGGSGNTPRFNVPYIFNEANVFMTFERKAKSIQDHLKTTAMLYRSDAIVVQNSATKLGYLPDNSIDLIFIDPPFGSNINYSEMNFLWESWLDTYTDTTQEAIVNNSQNKGINEYRDLILASLKECYRVLRAGHWLLLMFMNSSQSIWEAIREALDQSGFKIAQIDTFDKQHGTFKQFVSENTTGFDLVIHCQKPKHITAVQSLERNLDPKQSIMEFLKNTDLEKYSQIYLHVNRDNETDFRKLYSDWLSKSILEVKHAIEFAEFKTIVENWIKLYHTK